VRRAHPGALSRLSLHRARTVTGPIPDLTEVGSYNLVMNQPDGRTPRPDDTAAFRRFYIERGEPRSRLYRIFVGWWRDRG
jgi:hypothetical protein